MEGGERVTKMVVTIPNLGHVYDWRRKGKQNCANYSKLCWSRLLFALLLTLQQFTLLNLFTMKGKAGGTRDVSLCLMT